MVRSTSQQLLVMGGCCIDIGEVYFTAGGAGEEGASVQLLVIMIGPLVSLN